MHLKRITLAMLLMFGSISFAGQTGKIAGKVTDSQTSDALVGCNVLVKGTPYGASTDANGEY